MSIILTEDCPVIEFSTGASAPQISYKQFFFGTQVASCDRK